MLNRISSWNHHKISIIIIYHKQMHWPEHQTHYPTAHQTDDAAYQIHNDNCIQPVITQQNTQLLSWQRNVTFKIFRVFGSPWFWGHLMTFGDDFCMSCQGLPIGEIWAF